MNRESLKPWSKDCFRLVQYRNLRGNHKTPVGKRVFVVVVGSDELHAHGASVQIERRTLGVIVDCRLGARPDFLGLKAVIMTGWLMCSKYRVLATLEVHQGPTVQVVLDPMRLEVDARKGFVHHVETSVVRHLKFKD